MAIYWNMDSFGDTCPNNWEEIVSAVNAHLSDYEETTGAGEEELSSHSEELWEQFCGNDEICGVSAEWDSDLDERIVKDSDGCEIPFDAAVELMDDEIREDLHNHLSPCSDQEFFTAYEKAHREKYGEDFEVI